MSMNMESLFIPITKIDAAKRLVYGTLAEDRVDKVKERFDYHTSKPHVIAWSSEFERVTKGKSRGNLREMHTPSVAGHFEDVVCDDASKTVQVVGKVNSDSAWKHVLEGDYTGFSLGGKYLKRWPDPTDPTVTRYTARPSEGSLVDNPCMYGATFEVVKDDGSSEMRKFHPGEGNVGGNANEQPAQGTEASKDYGSMKAVKAAWAKANAAKEPVAAKRAILAAWQKGMKDGACDATKGFYEVSDLAALIAQLDFLCERLEVEQAQEGDQSAGLAQLEGAIQTLGDVLAALVSEEIEEESNGTEAGGLGGGPLFRAMTRCMAPVEKSGARHGSKDQGRVNQMHDLAVQLGCTNCDSSVSKGALAEGDTMTNEELGKALSDNNAALIDAMAKRQTTETQDAFTKALGEDGALTKAIGSTVEKAVAPINTAIDEIKKTLAEHTAQLAAPERPKGIHTGGKPTSIAKGADGANTEAPDLSKASPSELIKHAHASGGSPMGTFLNQGR